MSGSWVSLLPFLIVIPISIFTKQVQPGLFVALILGSYLKTPDLLGGMKSMISYIVKNMIQMNNIRIIIFLYLFAGIISMIKLAGGIKGFVFLVSKKIKSKTGAMALTWISTMFTFCDPDFRIVTIAPIMKALREKLNMSKQKIGIVIEITSNPVVGLIPIATAFVGYMVSVIHMAMKSSGIQGQPYIYYIKSIPFNFFSFVIIILGLYYTFFMHKDEASMKDDNKDLNEDQGEEGLEQCYRAYEKETPTKPWNFILPIFIVLSTTLFLSWWDGHSKAKNFFDAFLKSDVLGVMLEGLFIGLIFSLIFFMFQRINISKLVTHFVKGGNELMSVVIMLSLIWAVSNVAEDLGFSKYVTSHVTGLIPHFFIAPSLFVLGGILSYFIGSSWGTWGLLMPLGVALAKEGNANIFLCIGAVFASGTLGAFASPLSDNTVTLCTILDLPVIDYAKSKLLPTLIAGGITTGLYVCAAFVFR
ncbi:MAG: Na+/H+ antiporter NhaC family protein [Clostridium sp.]|uniref:Na+/H+ antiporter NhaC family protein n=1 Tax=Clostridium sp. TaxID=1506 RepID=UPI0039E80332